MNLESQAKAIMANAEVMAFLRAEALEQVAKEMQAKGYTCTAKAVDLLTMKHKNIADRVTEYVAAGVIGAMMAKAGV